MPWQEVTPVMQVAVRKLCFRAYPNHPKGCPNYNKKKGCPPSAPLLPETIDLSETVFAIWNVFPFGEHVQKMKDKHPEWSQRQLECCLYWQGTARKQLRAECRRFVEEMGKGWLMSSCPEAQGVNLTDTMRSIGIELEWPPVTVAYQIVLAGRARGKAAHEV